MATLTRRSSWKNAPRRPGPKPDKAKARAKAVAKRKRKSRAKPKPPPPLRDFQREGVDFLKAHDYRVILADAPGCGKTVQVLTAIREDAAKLTPALVVVPASVLRNWAKEAETWAQGARVQVLASQTDRLRKGYHLTITTWDQAVRREMELAAYGFRLVVADEAHLAKNPDTLRAQALRTLCDRAAHILPLTGTPLLNDISELRALEGLFGAEKPPMLRRLLEDVAPDIPPKTRVYFFASIPADIRDEYDKVREEFGLWLDDYLPTLMGGGVEATDAAERALAAEPLAKLAYLRRILGRGKVPAAAQWVRHMRAKNEAVVVFGHYSDVLSLLGHALSRLGISYVRVDGSTSTEARQAAVEAFQAGDFSVFLASSAAREGITLTRAANLLRFERDYVPAYEEQAEDRIRRIGQRRATTIWYLHAEHTIDERITEIVDRKRALVARTIGSAEVQCVELDRTLDQWKRMPALREGVPLVADNPKADIDLPKLPPKEVVQSVVLDPSKWPLDGLQRVLRRRGYRQRSIERLKGGNVRLHCRSVGAFRGGKVKPRKVAPGLVVLVGKRAVTDAGRMKATRAAKKARTLRVRKRKKKWSGKPLS